MSVDRAQSQLDVIIRNIINNRISVIKIFMNAIGHHSDTHCLYYVNLMTFFGTKQSTHFESNISNLNIHKCHWTNEREIKLLASYWVFIYQAVVPHTDIKKRQGKFIIPIPEPCSGHWSFLSKSI